ncbi:MAG TPA: hypothetical protein ENK21_05470 [Trueperaceae bacterium]|nr:hypothetical protein [Trueperaceae bacterium]
MMILIVLSSLFSLIYAIVNGFGSWMLARRKPWISALFMLAAAFLIVAFVGFIKAFPHNLFILAAGLILASATSLINAYVVLGKVTWRHHFYRLAAGLMIFAIAYFALS